VADYMAGALKTEPRSQPRPKGSQKMKAVKTVVGSTFAEMVMEPEKDVLLKFHAPWCGHCKELAPKYEEVGRAVYKLVKHRIAVAQIDHDTNDIDHPLVNLTGMVHSLPTVLLFRQADKSRPVLYNGKRDVAEFVRFVHQHATEPFELPEAYVGKEKEDEL
jgi:protein disulfide-isomerase-like protein